MARRGLFGSESLSKRSRGSATDGDVDITPMIDCVFLLLIFFMVSSTMQGTPDLDVPIANHSVGLDSRGAVVVTIRAATNPAEQPKIILGDGGGRTATLPELKQHIEENLRQGRSQVVLKAEGDVSHGFVDEAGQAIRGVTGSQLFIGVREGKVAAP